MSVTPDTTLMQNDNVQAPEEADMDEEVREEDAADVAARKRAAAKAREEAELRQRSQVLCIINALLTFARSSMLLFYCRGCVYLMLNACLLGLCCPRCL